MTEIPTTAFRQLYITKFLVGSDANLPSRLGHFVMWFGACETIITEILARVLGFYNYPQRLEFVIRGMDARVKCERLRQACEHLCPLGQNLSDRLTYFQNTIVPLRNRVSHSWPILENDGCIHFTSLGKVHGVEFVADSTLSSTPDFILLDDLLDRGIWLHAFSSDLLAAMACQIDGKPLEISDPQSNLLQGFQKARPPKVPNAKSGRRERKRLRKGLPSRGKKSDEIL